MRSPKYIVEVSNVGIVYKGNDVDETNRFWIYYKELSRNNIGRASGQAVILHDRDGNQLLEHFTTDEKQITVDEMKEVIEEAIEKEGIKNHEDT